MQTKTLENCANYDLIDQLAKRLDKTNLSSFSDWDIREEFESRYMDTDDDDLAGAKDEDLINEVASRDLCVLSMDMEKLADDICHSMNNGKPTSDMCRELIETLTGRLVTYRN